MGPQRVVAQDMPLRGGPAASGGSEPAILEVFFELLDRLLNSIFVNVEKQGGAIGRPRLDCIVEILLQVFQGLSERPQAPDARRRRIIDPLRMVGNGLLK